MVSAVVLGTKGDNKKVEKKEYAKVVSIIYQMLNAGYHSGKNKKKIDDWIIHFTDPLLQEYLTEYKVKTSAPDKTVTDEFLENPQFRKVILDMFIVTASNYGAENKLKFADLVDKEHPYVKGL